MFRQQHKFINTINQFEQRHVQPVNQNCEDKIILWTTQNTAGHEPVGPSDQRRLTVSQETPRTSKVVLHSFTNTFDHAFKQCHVHGCHRYGCTTQQPANVMVNHDMNDNQHIMTFVQ